MPPALENRPQLSIFSYLYYETFSELSGGRQNGMDLNPIMFSEVMAYCDELGVISVEERFTFWRMVHGCDAELMSLQQEKRATKQGSGKKSKK